MKNLKRWISLLLVLSMCVLMASGCSSEPGNVTPDGSQPNSSGKNPTSSSQINKDVIYKSEVLSFDLPMSDINQIVSNGQRLFICGGTYDETTWAYTYYIVSCNLDGSELKTIYVQGEEESKYPAGIDPLSAAVAEVETTGETDEAETTGETDEEEETEPEIPDVIEPDTYSGSDVQQLAATADGNLVLLINEYTSTPDEWYNVMKLVKIDGYDGTEIWSVELGDDISWINNMACVGDQILMNCETEFIVFDDDGNQIKRMSVSGVDWISSMIVLKNESVYITYYGENGMLFAPVNIQTGEVGEGIDASWYNQGFNILPGNDQYDLFLWNSTLVAGYNFGDTAYTEILNFIDSDIDASSMSFLYPIDEQTFLGSGYNPDDWQRVIYQFTKVNPDDVKDKIVITLGSLWTDYSITKQVIKFNKSNDEYRIKLVSYRQYATADNPDGAVTQLNNDIIGGKMPDILVTDRYSMPIGSYIQKGVFEDLNSWIDNDPELNREDFLTNVFDAYSVDGKLYQLVPTFYVYSVAGKTSVVGDQPGWTLEDVRSLMAEYPDSELFNMTTRSEILSSCMTYVGDQFIDEVNHTCNFDSEEFIQLLEWANEFPAEIDYDVYNDENYWLYYDTMYRENRVLLNRAYLYDFNSFKQMRGYTFGEPVTYIGFPTSSGNGAVIQGDTTFAMSAQSSNKEGAWQFLRYYLSEEYQTSSDRWGFSVRLSVLQEDAEEATKPYTYIDENGEEVEVEDTYWIGNEEVVVPRMTMEEVNGYIEYIKTVNHIATNNDDILNIINEEAESYFSGQKTAADVAKIIQSRAKIFISENE